MTLKVNLAEFFYETSIMETIKAFGLVTRYWTKYPIHGYGCAECCNRDRCDEDCDAPYYRPNCPHCKGKGWIQEEDLDKCFK